MEKEEVIISNGDGLQSVQTLFERVMAVCYIETVSTVIKEQRKKERLKRGSGFYSVLRLELLGEVFGVFTNNHVLGSLSEAENAYATFGYEGSSGGQRIKLRPEVIFRTHKELDYTFVGINKQDVENLQLNIKPIIVMEPEPSDLKKDDGIFIFQHPKGQPKQYSQDKILHVERPFVFYNADTETGSSGSPVLTSVGLKLVAIHHKGSEELGYNKGTLISEVLSHLNNGTYTQPVCGVSDSQDKEIFEDEPPAKRPKIESKNRPSEDELEDLSKEIASFWKSLGRKLKIPNASIDEIQNDNVQFPRVRDKSFQMLMVWVDQQGESATFSELSRALKALRNNRLAQKYCSGL